MAQIDYRVATRADLESLWAFNIAENPGDDRWVRWRDEYIGYNQTGQAVTFTVAVDQTPVGEGTLLLSPDCGAIDGRTQLADGQAVANVNALRMAKAYEGKGYMSALMRLMEAWARTHGYQRLTIGVEARETRNLAIYLHWGYCDFVLAEEEDGELVLYYAKKLKSMPG